MHDPRFEEPLSDAALERAIEQALAVEPSPAFVARVRHRVSTEKPLRAQRQWRVVGLVACAAPLLLLALYLGLTSPSRTSGDPVRLDVSQVATATPDDDVAPAEDVRVAVARDESRAAAPPAARATTRVARQATRVPVRDEEAPARRTIVLPDVVISPAEVSAVLAVANAVPRNERSPVVMSERVDGAVESGVSTLDLVEMTIAPLAIEPLDLAANFQGESE